MTIKRCIRFGKVAKVSLAANELTSHNATEDSVECIDHGKTTDLNVGGYGKQWRNGKRYLVHRLVYCDAHGLDIFDIAGLVVRHICDNPRCINPAHLLLGTQEDNMRDKVTRNRQAFNKLNGTSNGRCKISDEEVEEIRRCYIPRDAEYSQFALARKYGISNQQVSRIINNKLRVPSNLAED